LEIVEAIRALSPDERRRLQRRLRVSGLVARDEYLTDRNRLRVATSLKLEEMKPGEQSPRAQAPQPEAKPPAYDAPAPVAAPENADEDYRSPVSGKMVVGAPAAEETPQAMAPVPGQAPEQPIEIIFDGGSHGNPGQGYGSYAARWPGANQQIVRLRFGERVTNNEAEYDTLIAALEATLKRLEDQHADLSSASLEIRGDSLLVVNQVMGRWECKEPRLQVRCDRVRYLLQHFGRWQLTHHRREHSVETLGH
jgi:ribonuclease HI